MSGWTDDGRLVWLSGEGRVVVGGLVDQGNSRKGQTLTTTATILY